MPSATVPRRLNSLDVIDTLADVMLGHGIPEHIQPDNGPEFIAHELQKWLAPSAVGGIDQAFRGDRNVEIHLSAAILR